MRRGSLLAPLVVAAFALVAAGPALAESPRARVVIDPGHGGQNMGALGAYGVYEKYVTLSIALRLGRLLEAEPDIATFFTRKDDVFVDLKDRPAIANALDADVFVSIHCNASTVLGAHGIETFFLGGGGTDADADEVAERENDFAVLVDGRDEDPRLAAIVGDMRRNANLQESGVLAETVQRRMLASFPEAASRDVRQARFAVLRRAEMPSIVVEVGFLTHVEEGLHLILEPYQDRIAASLRDAIVAYVRGQGVRTPTARLR
jgi:N-acetylmuramoyl-L-alanine amidase